jgi:metallo-beta-lactamase family protein
VHLTEPGRSGLQLVFSGDVGRSSDLLMPPPQPVKQADVLIVESTYGNRDHPDDDPLDRLADIVKHTVQRGGSVLMPAFAVGRAQALLLLLQRLRRAGRLDPRIPIFLDSPMAIEATALYRRHAKLLAVPAGEMRNLCDGVRMVTTLQQSQRLAGSRYPAIIISASGMATGGRVLGHLKAMAPEPRHTLLFAGFQVGGSRGARLMAGEREVKIFGEMVPVRADVQQLAGISGHADRHELLAWLRHIRQAPQQTFVVHGEPDASDTLRSTIRNELGWPARVPAHGECAEV